MRNTLNHLVPHRIVTGLWSLSRRAALRMASMSRYRAVRAPCSMVCCFLEKLHVWCIWFLLQFGIEDLKALPNQTDCWDGVRNYQVEPQNPLRLSRRTDTALSHHILTRKQKKRVKITSFFFSLGKIPLSSPGPKFYEADERRAVGFLLPQ